MDTLKELIAILLVAGVAVYIAWLTLTLIDGRARYRMACQCGRHERHYTASAAKWAVETHTLACRGTAIAWPLPTVDIAKAAEKRDTEPMPNLKGIA